MTQRTLFNLIKAACLCVAIQACLALGLRAQRLPTRGEAAIAISRFTLLGSDPTASWVAARTPDLLRIALLRFSWIEARTRPEASLTADSLREEGVRFWLTGEILPLRDEMLLTVRVTNLENDQTVYEKVELVRGDILRTIAQIGDDIADRLERQLTTASGVSRRFAIARFRSLDRDSSDDVFETILFEEFRGPLESALAKANIRNAVIDTVAPGSTDADAGIFGEYSVRGDTLIVSATLRERESGVMSKVKVTGSVHDVFGVPLTLADRVAELIEGRLTPDGKWRPPDLLRGNAGALAERASERVRAGDYATAILLYRKAIEREPGFTEAYLGLARVYRAMDQYEAALAELREGRRWRPNDPELYLVAGETYIDNAEYDQAIRELQQALGNAGDNREVAFQAQLQLGNVLTRLGDYPQAIARYERARNIHDQRPEAYHALGRAFRATGELDRATSVLQRGRERFPGDSAFRDELASIHNELGDQHLAEQRQIEAAAEYLKTLDLNPPDKTVTASAYRGLADLLHEAGEYQRALERYQLAQELEPTPRGYAWLGDLHRHVGQYDSAFANLRIAISSDRHDEWAHRLMGLTFKDQGLYDSAITKLTDAINVRPTVWSYGALGDAYRLNRQYKEAIASLEQAIKLDPNYLTARRDLGLTYRDSTDYRKALEQLQGVADRLHSAGSYADVAEVYLLVGQSVEAISWANKALEVDSNHVYAHEIQGRAKHERGDYEGAMEAALRIIRIEPARASAYGLLSGAFENLKQFDEAARTLEQLVAQDSSNVLARQYLSYMYHEYLFKYEPAYQQHLAVINLGHNNPGDRANLAESQLTSRRYTDALKQALALLEESRLSKTDTLDTDMRLTMKLVAIAARLLLQEHQAASVASWDFVSDYRASGFGTIPASQLSWSYSGTRHFIETEPMQEGSRSLITRLIDLLDRKKPTKNLQEFEKFLLSWR